MKFFFLRHWIIFVISVILNSWNLLTRSRSEPVRFFGILAYFPQFGRAWTEFGYGLSISGGIRAKRSNWDHLYILCRCTMYIVYILYILLICKLSLPSCVSIMWYIKLKWEFSFKQLPKRFMFILFRLKMLLCYTVWMEIQKFTAITLMTWIRGNFKMQKHFKYIRTSDWN